MEDDRVTENADGGGFSFLKIVGVFGFGFVLIALWFYISESRNDRGALNPVEKTVPEVSTPIVMPSPPPETREQYIKSTRLIGSKKDGIYLKDFTKNPDKYKG